MTKSEKTQARTGGETAPERFLDRHLGNAVHLFLTFLAVLILVAAAIATFEIIVRDFPMLWRAQTNEYDALHQIIQDVLLIAIAAELALLLLFHKTSAAVEVLIFVIARKMTISGISGLELLGGVAALAGLVVIRFYFIKPKESPAKD